MTEVKIDRGAHKALNEEAEELGLLLTDEETAMLPDCCKASEGSSFAHKLYALYNLAGERKGVNYMGVPCPEWHDLPADVKKKWRAVAFMTAALIRRESEESFKEGRSERQSEEKMAIMEKRIAEARTPKLFDPTRRR